MSLPAEELYDELLDEDAKHIMWRGEPQFRPERWTCSGCGFTFRVDEVADASRARSEHRVFAVLHIWRNHTDREALRGR